MHIGELVRRAAMAGLATAAASIAMRSWLRSRRRFSFEGKVVLVTGGSRGLGLELARQLVASGARVAICARSPRDLEAAERELQQRGEVLAITCDIRDAAQVQRMVSQIVQRWGTVDVLINNAGIIQVGPLDSMTLADFQEAMDTHYWGSLYTILAVLPIMRERGWGRIVNVASIGGKRGVPHLVPYSGSKFALVGLSQALRAELARENILVTTISPSLMRTGSPRNAIFKGQNRREYAWFSISDSLPVMSLDSTRAAQKILQVCQQGDPEALIAGPMYLPEQLMLLANNWSQEVLGQVNRLLPSMGGIGTARARGYESQSAWSPSILTKLGDQAAVQNNEIATGGST